MKRIFTRLVATTIAITVLVNAQIGDSSSLTKAKEIKITIIDGVIHTSILNSHFLFFIIPFYQINKITLR